MNRCRHPDHPHCTVWVMPGATVCAHGHAQPAPDAGRLDSSLTSFDMISRLRAGRAADAIVPAAPAPLPTQVPARDPAAPQADLAPAARPHLHVSGFDPRAAGGRQTIKLELRGMPDELDAAAAAELTLLLQSALLPGGSARLQFTRSLRGAWRPLFVEFSSRGREHGQYRIDLELHARPAGRVSRRAWVCTLVLLVPRPDASLGEIHQTFLSTHKNVRIHADDASIARLHGLDGASALDIDIQASNASIAQLDLAQFAPASRRIDLALPTIAWDEDLIEIDQPASRAREAAAHPSPASAACLVYAEPDAGFPRHLRLFALDECVLGRFEPAGAEADLLLQHYGEHGPDAEGLTRRLSARHALIRAGRQGFEIEDASRYGLLLDGVWPSKGVAVPLRLGMRIELTASIKGVVVLVVTGLLPHGVLLHRVDGGGAAEAFMLLAPECRPTLPLASASLPRASALPTIFHRDGGFWHLDPGSSQETPLSPATVLDRLAGFYGQVRFAGGPRPEDWVERRHPGTRSERRRAPSATVPGP